MTIGFDSIIWFLTAKYPYAGQNLATSGSSGKAPNSDADELSDAVKRWFEGEHPHGKYWGWMKFINNYESLPSNQ